MEAFEYARPKSTQEAVKLLGGRRARRWLWPGART